MGDWLYKRFDRNPEIWRDFRSQGETKSIAWSIPLTFVTCAAFALLCTQQNLHAFGETLKLAVMVWLIGPPPVAHYECAIY